MNTKYDCIIIRYNELGLKGKNRIHFENRLIGNIEDCLNSNKILFKKIKRVRGRIIIYTQDPCIPLKDVFGISSFSQCLICKPKIKDIKNISESLTAGLNPKKTFRVSASRADKDIEFNSDEIMRELGTFIIEKTNAKVSLKNFDFELGIEIFDKTCFVYSSKVEGLGGLPLGTGGKVIVYYESKLSLVAAWLMMKRGFEIIFLNTTTESDLITKIGKYSYGSSIIIEDAKDITQVSKKFKVNYLVLPQDINSIKKIDTELLILRPLVGYDQGQQEKILKMVLG